MVTYGQVTYGQLCYATNQLSSLVGTLKSLRENLVRGENEKCIYSDIIRIYVIYQIYFSSRDSILVSLMTVTIASGRQWPIFCVPLLEKRSFRGLS